MGTVTFDGTRVNDAEALSAGNWTWVKSTADGATATLEPDYKYQGTYCISAQIKTSLVGIVGFDTVTSYDYSTGPKVWLAKIIQTNKDSIDGTGLRIEISSDTAGTRTNYYYYDVFTAITYPIAGGWQIVPVDPTIAGYRSGTSGTPNLASISLYGIRSDAAETAKAPNVGIDAIDFITHGTGLTLTGTSSAFDDFVAFDEGTVNNRYGIVSTREGILYIVGVLTIGSPISSVVFSDSNETIVFPSGRFNTGFCGIDLDLSNASTTVSMTTITMIGRGYYGADGATADTRPDFGISGTSGTATISACAFTNFNVVTLTSTVTFSDNVVNVCESLIQAQSSIDGCTFDSPTVATGVAFATVVDPADITNCSFVSGGVGHAMELTSTTGSPFSFTGNTFSGYSTTSPGSNLISSSGSNDAMIYNNSGGALTLNITDGTTPTVRNGAGATTTIVAGAVTVTLIAKTADDTKVQSAEVFVKVSDGTGPFPFEESITIVNSGTTATVTHTAHGIATDDEVYIQGASLDANLGIFTIIVTGVNTYTYTMGSTPGSSPTGTITSTFTILNGATDVNGEVTMTRVFASDQPFNGWARKSTGSPYYRTGLVSGTVSSTTGAVPVALMILDE